MAGGWAKDGAVGEQIEASIAEELERLRARKGLSGESLTHCAGCGDEIPEARRDAIPGDHVCVVPARRSAAANENAIAGSRVDPTGPYGPNTCKPGFVWREAYSGDVVCVTPARRTEVKQENIDGPSHRVNP